MPVLSSIRRRASRVLVVAALIASGSVVVSAGPAHAAGCAGGVVCGKVDNQSDFGMYTTVGLNSADATDRCDVWNRSGGSASDPGIWKCWQRYLGPHSSRGGNFTGTDIDAFTFNDRPYYLEIDGKSLLVQQGNWTKISDTQTATCKNYVSSAARCVVWYTG
ncbi:MAG: hypothetical protein QG622_812 [Actinomycetota bacterium]|nr:hypothetical protein [Actinomycetota bacterium]